MFSLKGDGRHGPQFWKQSVGGCTETATFYRSSIQCLNRNTPGRALPLTGMLTPLDLRKNNLF
jgi:hypothetical protein